jgi:hypothetical protein
VLSFCHIPGCREKTFSQRNYSNYEQETIAHTPLQSISQKENLLYNGEEKKPRGIKSSGIKHKKSNPKGLKANLKKKQKQKQGHHKRPSAKI